VRVVLILFLSAALCLMMFLPRENSPGKATEIDVRTMCFRNMKTLIGAIELYSLDEKGTIVLGSEEEEYDNSLGVLLVAGYVAIPILDPEFPNTRTYRTTDDGYVWCTHHGAITGCSWWEKTGNCPEEVRKWDSDR
jgi:hypothetical protein